MCGIVGLFYFDQSKNIDHTKLIAARDSMLHRGPDAGGIFVDQNIGIAHRRLSIIDLSNNGSQPMVTASGRYMISYNGEIYNYQEIKAEIEKKGIQLKSYSDTEVLLHAYEIWGEKILEKLNGMFAFAIWDKQDRKLFLARDRVGIKPLYYVFNNRFIAFASEIKALFKLGIPIEIQPEKINELFVYRHVAGSSTIYNDVYKLLPGRYIIVDQSGKKEESVWWDLAERIKNHKVITNPLEWFKDTFDSSVRNHMLSEVPVGVLLSGGLDSSSICASLHKQHFKDIHAFNVGFKNYTDDESIEAAKIARKFDFPFHSIHVEDDHLAENLSIADFIMDEPLIHQNEPQLVAISKLAKKNVTVLLSGEGADEFLGGYVRYKPLYHSVLSKLALAVLPALPERYKSKRLEKLERYMSLGTDEDKVIFNSISTFPNDLKKIGLKNFEINIDYRRSIYKTAKELYPNSLARQAMFLDQHAYLHTLNDRNDRCTMAASIECRVPFLDHRLMEGLGTLDDKWFFQGKKSKFLLKESYKDVLPQETLQFRKIGFSVPWIEYIFKSQKLKHHWDTMHESELFRIGFLSDLDIPKIRDTALFNEPSNKNLLRQLFFMSLWWEQYYEHFKKQNQESI